MAAILRFLLLATVAAVIALAKERNHHLHTYEGYTDYLVFRNNLADRIAKAHLTLLAPHVLLQAADIIYFTLANKIPGDIAEFGVYRGGGSIMMASVLFFLEPDTTRIVHMFDSFAGHPDYGATKDLDFDLVQYSGQIVAPIEGVISALEEFGLMHRNIVLHKGWFKDTVPLLDRPLALIRADGDAYTSTSDILNNAYKLLSPGGAVIVDDYQEYQSCRNAIHDFFKANNIPAEDLKYVDGGAIGLRPYWIKRGLEVY